MKTMLLSLTAAASVLTSCETAPHHNIQVNHTDRGDINTAGYPVHRVVDSIPYSPPGTVNISTDEWARFQNLQYQQKLRDAENQAFAEKHLRGW